MDHSQVRLYHAPGKTHASCDDEQVIAYSGLLAAMRLAERCGLADLVGDSVAIGDRDGVNAAAKVGGIVAGGTGGGVPPDKPGPGRAWWTYARSSPSPGPAPPPRGTSSRTPC